MLKSSEIIASFHKHNLYTSRPSLNNVLYHSVTECFCFPQLMTASTPDTKLSD